MELYDTFYLLNDFNFIVEIYLGLKRSNYMSYIVIIYFLLL